MRSCDADNFGLNLRELICVEKKKLKKKKTRNVLSYCQKFNFLRVFTEMVISEKETLSRTVTCLRVLAFIAYNERIQMNCSTKFSFARYIFCAFITQSNFCTFQLVNGLDVPRYMCETEVMEDVNVAPEAAVMEFATSGNHISKNANGNIITLTLKNNHLIVETEERAVCTLLRERNFQRIILLEQNARRVLSHIFYASLYGRLISNFMKQRDFRIPKIVVAKTR